MLKFFITNISKQEYRDQLKNDISLRFLEHSDFEEQELFFQSLREGLLKRNYHIINLDDIFANPHIQKNLDDLISIQKENSDLIYFNLNQINIKDFPDLYLGDKRIFVDADQLDQDGFFSDFFYHPNSIFYSFKNLNQESQKSILSKVADYVVECLPSEILFDQDEKCFISIGCRDTIRDILYSSVNEINDLIHYEKKSVDRAQYTQVAFNNFFKEKKFLLYLCQHQFSLIEDYELREKAQQKYQFTLENFLELSPSNEVVVNTRIAARFHNNMTDILERQFLKKLEQYDQSLFSFYETLREKEKKNFINYAINKFAEDFMNGKVVGDILLEITQTLKSQKQTTTSQIFETVDENTNPNTIKRGISLTDAKFQVRSQTEALGKAERFHGYVV